MEPSKSNGLSVKSVALLFHIRTIDKKRFKNKIGMVDSIIIIKKIDKILKSLLDI